MPTIYKKNQGWMARVVVRGTQVTSKVFPPGKKYGPEWRAAKEWEEQEKYRLQNPVDKMPIPTGLERLLGWGEAYLAHAGKTMSIQTHAEKKTIMLVFFSFCRERKIFALEDISKAKAYRFLSDVSDMRGAKVANKYRKNMLAAWNWGADFYEGFPGGPSPFRIVKAFPVVQADRYIPPEEDVIKVIRQAKGQDLVMLLTLYFTGARRGEVFRLSWERDIRMDTGKIRLTDNKSGSGSQRYRWLDMHPELAKALAWWHKVRELKVDHVFYQSHCHLYAGEAYKERRHFMLKLCQKAGVRPFGFHAIRHKSAAITFVSGGLTAAQILMGHYRATTTDIYVKSAGLYADQTVIMEALGKSRIGRAAQGLLKEMPQGEVTLEANCKPDHVNPMIHSEIEL